MLHRLMYIMLGVLAVFAAVNAWMGKWVELGIIIGACALGMEMAVSLERAYHGKTQRRKPP